MAKFTITGMADEELKWVADTSKRTNFSMSVIVRNAINNERQREIEPNYKRKDK